jgi:hypothetical protein
MEAILHFTNTLVFKFHQIAFCGLPDTLAYYSKVYRVGFIHFKPGKKPNRKLERKRGRKINKSKAALGPARDRNPEASPGNLPALSPSLSP